GDGSLAGTTQNPSHVYASAGTYTASVTVTDANGATVSASAPALTVVPVPLSASVTMSPATGDAPLPVTLTSHITGGTAPFTYAWTTGDGSASTLPSFSHTYGTGSYTIGLTVTDSAGKSIFTTTYETVYPPMSVSASAAPVAGTEPLAVAFTASAAGGLAPYTFGWQFGDGTSASGTAVTHSYGAGSFGPTLTVHDSAGGTWTATVASINVQALPASGGNHSTGGGSSGNTATPPAQTPNPPSNGSPSPSGLPTPTADQSANPASSPTSPASPSGSNGSLPVLVAVLGSVLAAGVGGWVFLGWRGRRLR
ncbi:MAG TPA: PKD domain-containing protein, partial [Candidatus Dormibacteraeota bacterium]|nr:PKD domain-containing protein [Candidatus Dormibacteraeota bacterium]